jgi:hypothetical protein
LLSDNINQIYVTKNVPPVKLPLPTCVSLVDQTELLLQPVNASKVSMKTIWENVSHVEEIVNLVSMKTLVSSVKKTD